MSDIQSRNESTYHCLMGGPQNYSFLPSEWKFKANFGTLKSMINEVIAKRKDSPK
jgi:hypothetical protein